MTQSDPLAKAASEVQAQFPTTSSYVIRRYLEIARPHMPAEITPIDEALAIEAVRQELEPRFSGEDYELLRQTARAVVLAAFKAAGVSVAGEESGRD